MAMVRGGEGIVGWYSILGHITSDILVVSIQAFSSIIILSIEKIARLLFGKPSTDFFEFEPHAQRFRIEQPVYKNSKTFAGKQGEIDVEQSLELSPYPIKGDELIERTKAVLGSSFGVKNPDLLAEDFRFVAPVVGPLGKEEFIRVFGSFSLDQAMPDLKENYWGFTVDPLEPNRVWWWSRPSGTHTGPLMFPPPTVIPPTGIKVQWPVQAQSMLFNEAGQCYQLTVGYPCDRQIGNTGGLGAVFGLLHAIKKPLPFKEAYPWKPSPMYRLGLRLGKVFERFGYGPGLSPKK